VRGAAGGEGEDEGAEDGAPQASSTQRSA
jgi:hypothetical protein